MRLLLDTHVLIWWLAPPSHLTEKARDAIERAESVSVSVATAWEIEIKKATGKLTVPDDLLDQIAAKGFRTVAITGEHAVMAGRLPRLHDDPFDRMLVAQAVVEGLVIVTRDARFAEYGVPLIRG